LVFGEVMTKILSSIKLPVATQANVETAYSGAGLIYYDSVNAVIRVHDGTSWSSLGGSSSIDMPIGSIQPWLGASTPSGWLVCTGQAVSRSTYSGLFSVISTRFGTGDGSTTFNVPNLQGYQVVGAAGLDLLGNVDNTATFRQGSVDAHSVAAHIGDAASHSHSLTYTAFTELEHTYSHTHTATASEGTITFAGHTFSDTSNLGQSHTHTSSVASGAATSGVATGTTRASTAHTHAAPTVSTNTHQHSVTTASWSAHDAHRHSPVFDLTNSGNTTSASPASHNHTATPSSNGSHTHTDHSYKTYMVHYIIKAA
jgi:microcystin-dependent protein